MSDRVRRNVCLTSGNSTQDRLLEQNNRLQIMRERAGGGGQGKMSSVGADSVKINFDPGGAGQNS